MGFGLMSNREVVQAYRRASAASPERTAAAAAGD